ncbi:MAG: redoxin domain-containing protein [Chromatiaceae bacterium]
MEDKPPVTRNEADQEQPAARPKRLGGWLVNIVLVLMIFAGVQWWKARPLASGEAPPLAGETLDGSSLDLARYRGRPVLVHFWASWCPVCKAMDGTIDSIAADHRVITVAMQSGGTAEIGRFMADSDLSFTVIPDPDGRIASLWGVPGVPASFVLDPAGRIAFSTIGISTEPGLRARLWAAARTE